MTIDLSKAVKGSKVYFRCGGEAVVINNIPSTGGRDTTTWLDLEGYGSQNFWLCGDQYGCPKPCPMDIIRIEPPAFNWDDVKPGMAFFTEGIRFFYVGECKLWNKPVFSTAQGNAYVVKELPVLEFYIRAPEHDIQVKS